MKKADKEDRMIEEIKRHNSVLMEHMEDQVKIVAEQYGSIAKKLDILDEHSRDLAIIKSELGNVKVCVAENTRHLHKVDQRLDTIDQTLDTIDQTLDTIDQTLDKVDQRLNNLEEGQVRIENKLDAKIDNHEARIKNLEEKVLT